MAVDVARMMAELDELSRIGRTASGGVTRLGLTPENAAAKELVARWMAEAGLSVRYDAAANLIARLGGDGPAIVLASHLDSVIDGGRFDGPMGVVIALEVARLLAGEKVEPARPLEVVAFSDEEGTRFGTGFFGSRAMVGALPRDILDRKDKNGLSIAQAMQALGYPPDRIGDADRDPGEVIAYLEVHVEQGSVLDQLEVPVGVVTGIAGPAHLQVTLRGRADHAGATPMNLRRDPLAAAAQVIVAAEKLAKEVSPTAVATVGQVWVEPGAVNVIPGLAVFSLDIRDVEKATRDELIGSILDVLRQVCADRQIEWDVEEHLRVDPVPLSPRVQAALAQACREVGVPVHRMPSGAGHDAMIFAPLAETGMLFVRSREGVSHSPAERTDEGDIAVAAEVLWRAALALAV
jgi:allantoate deiminase